MTARSAMPSGSTLSRTNTADLYWWRERGRHPETPWWGVALRELRERSGLSIRELAERSGIGASTWWKTENGFGSPRIDILERMLKAAGGRIGIVS